MINLSESYPKVAKFFKKHVADWDTWDKNAAIVEALDALEEDGGYYELEARYTQSGRPELLHAEDLPNDD